VVNKQAKRSGLPEYGTGAATGDETLLLGQADRPRGPFLLSGRWPKGRVQGDDPGGRCRIWARGELGSPPRSGHSTWRTAGATHVHQWNPARGAKDSRGWGMKGAVTVIQVNDPYRHPLDGRTRQGRKTSRGLTA